MAVLGRAMLLVLSCTTLPIPMRSVNPVCTDPATLVQGKNRQEFMNQFTPTLLTTLNSVGQTFPGFEMFMKTTKACQQTCLQTVMQQSLETMWGTGLIYSHLDYLKEALTGALKACYPRPPRELVVMYINAVASELTKGVAPLALTTTIAPTVAAPLADWGLNSATSPRRRGLATSLKTSLPRRLDVAMNVTGESARRLLDACPLSTADGHGKTIVDHFVSKYPEAWSSVVNQNPTAANYFLNVAKQCQTTCGPSVLATAIATFYQTGLMDGPLAGEYGQDVVTGGLKACYPDFSHDAMSSLTTALLPLIASSYQTEVAQACVPDTTVQNGQAMQPYVANFLSVMTQRLDAQKSIDADASAFFNSTLECQSACLLGMWNLGISTLWRTSEIFGDDKVNLATKALQGGMAACYPRPPQKKLYDLVDSTVQSEMSASSRRRLAALPADEISQVVQGVSSNLQQPPTPALPALSALSNLQQTPTPALPALSALSNLQQTPTPALPALPALPRRLLEACRGGSETSTGKAWLDQFGVQVPLALQTEAAKNTAFKKYFTTVKTCQNDCANQSIRLAMATLWNTGSITDQVQAKYWASNVVNGALQLCFPQVPVQPLGDAVNTLVNTQVQWPAADTTSRHCIVATEVQGTPAMNQADYMAYYKPLLAQALAAVEQQNEVFMSWYQTTKDCQNSCLMNVYTAGLETLWSTGQLFNADRPTALQEMLTGGFKACYPSPPRQQVSSIMQKTLATLNTPQARRLSEANFTDLTEEATNQQSRRLLAQCQESGPLEEMFIQGMLKGFPIAFKSVLQNSMAGYAYFTSKTKDCQNSCSTTVLSQMLKTFYEAGFIDQTGYEAKLQDAITGAMKTCYPLLDYSSLHILVGSLMEQTGIASAEQTANLSLGWNQAAPSISRLYETESWARAPEDGRSFSQLMTKVVPSIFIAMLSSFGLLTLRRRLHCNQPSIGEVESSILNDEDLEDM